MGGHAALEGLRGQTSETTTLAETVLQSMTPAADPASEHTVMPPSPGPSPGPSWLDVPVQRPRELRDNPPVAPPPPLPFQDVHHAQSVEWKPGDARLPPFEATEDWNPDDARIPKGAGVVATRAYWNPNSAVLPRPHRIVPATWNPDDARLPSS